MRIQVTWKKSSKKTRRTGYLEQFRPLETSREISNQLLIFSAEVLTWPHGNSIVNCDRKRPTWVPLLGSDGSNRKKKKGKQSRQRWVICFFFFFIFFGSVHLLLFGSFVHGGRCSGSHQCQCFNSNAEVNEGELKRTTVKARTYSL